MGATPHRLANEASLLNLWGLSPATINNVAALSVPMPGKETNPGAACATSRSRCASSSTISAHPSQADHVQRTVGIPVAYIRLRRCLTTLPEEASMGATPHRLAKEASRSPASGGRP